MKPFSFRALALAGLVLSMMPSIGIATASSTEIQPRVEIFFVRWDLLTGSALTSESVRENFSVHAQIRDAWMIKKLRSDVDNLTCSKSPLGPAPADVRLVLEFYAGSEEPEIFSLDQALLYDTTGKSCVISDALKSNLRIFDLESKDEANGPAESHMK